MDAVNKLSQQIAAGPTTGSAGSRENDLDAIVADVDGTSLTINAGSAAGLAKGQTFTIYHKGKEIKDPKTGEVLDVQTTPIGTAHHHQRSRSHLDRNVRRVGRPRSRGRRRRQEVTR